MKTAAEIDREIGILKRALTSSRRWSAGTRKIMTESIAVLAARMTPSTVEREYYVDETTPEYSDGDNELWAELDRVSRWMMGEKDAEAPSQGI